MVATTTNSSNSNGGSTTPNVTTRSKRQQSSDSESKPLPKRVKGGHDSEADSYSGQEQEPVNANIQSVTSESISSTVPRKSQEDFPKRPQKIALFHHTPQGIFFSSTQKRLSFDESKFALKGGVQPVAIVSSQSLERKKVPTLGAIRPHVNRPRGEQKTELTLPGVKLLDYGPFTSFAPIVDTSQSMVSLQNIALVQDLRSKTRNYQKRAYVDSTTPEPEDSEEELRDNSGTEANAGEMNNIESKKEASPKDSSNSAENDVSNTTETSKKTDSQNNETPKDIEIDKQLFLEAGVDVDLILKAVEANGKQSEGNEQMEITTPIQVEDILMDNAILLSELQKLQDERFLNNPNVITEREKELAETLKKRLVDLTSKVPPSLLISLRDIEKAAAQIPLRDSAYQGNLPPNKPYGFATNKVSNDAFLPSATAIPASELTNHFLSQLQIAKSMHSTTLPATQTTALKSIRPSTTYASPQAYPNSQHASYSTPQNGYPAIPHTNLYSNTYRPIHPNAFQSDGGYPIPQLIQPIGCEESFKGYSQHNGYQTNHSNVGYPTAQLNGYQPVPASTRLPQSMPNIPTGYHQSGYPIISPSNGYPQGYQSSQYSSPINRGYPVNHWHRSTGY